jgi:hypothetical protein
MLPGALMTLKANTIVTAGSLLLVASFIGLLSGTAEAKTYHYSKQVQRACVSDYKRYCGEYGVGSSALRSCMKRAGKRLSNGCVNALVASGQVPIWSQTPPRPLI